MYADSEDCDDLSFTEGECPDDDEPDRDFVETGWDGPDRDYEVERRNDRIEATVRRWR